MSRDSQIGTALRDQRAALVLAVVGVALVGASVALPLYGTLLFAWGGTALFGAVLLVVLGQTRAVRAEVATDIYTTLAGNCRGQVDGERTVYVPDDGEVRLVTGAARLEPTGAPLVDRIEAASVTHPEMTSGRLQALVDGLVAELELADDAAGETGDGEARVTASDCRIGTDELFDHPIASLTGVGLARTLGEPVRVETDVEDDALVVDCYWGDVEPTRSASAGAAERGAEAGTDGWAPAETDGEAAPGTEAQSAPEAGTDGT